MFKKEVDYRLAKWLLLNMEKDGVISSEETNKNQCKLQKTIVNASLP